MRGWWRQLGAEGRSMAVASLVAVAAATALSATWLDPQNAQSWNDAVTVLSVAAGGIVAALAQAIVVWLASGFVRELLGATAAVLVTLALLPAAALGWGATLQDDQRAWDEAGRVFAAYTHRFPEGRLGDTFVQAGSPPIVLMCAQEGPARRPDRGGAVYDPRFFCVEVNVDAPRGRQVNGTMRAQIDDLGADYYYCSGDTVWCVEP